MKTFNWFWMLFLGMLCAAGLTGWVLNIVRLATENESFGVSLARAAGIFIAPVGAVLGYF